MQIFPGSRQVAVAPELYIVLAFAVLILPVRWVFAWLFASAFHELCHYIALKICGCNIFSIRINGCGAIMETDLTGRGEELFCALAGPAGGLLLLLAARWFPRTAICALVQSAYNLLPIFPLDGGRAVHAMLRKHWSEEKAGQFSRLVNVGTLAVLGLLCLYASFVLLLGVLPLVLWLMLIWKHKLINIPCKESRLRVQ